MTSKLSCNEAIERIESNIEHVNARMTSYELFFENVSNIISTLRGNSR